MPFTAHIRESDKAVQTVGEHCSAVAELAEKYLDKNDLGAVGRLTGLLHDAGKLNKEFDDYINGRSGASRGSIDHSFAGAKYLASLGGGDNRKRVAAVSMAHTIVSHHGLHDWLDGDCNDYFKARISKEDNYEEVLENMGEIVGDTDISALFEKAVRQWYAATNIIKPENSTEFSFYIGMLERLIQSALIDADHTDTAAFCSGEAVSDEKDTASLWADMDSRMDEKLKAFEKKTDPISRQRRSISDRCAAFAENRVGACRLIVPTGGGKTLSSMRFAIKQCRKFGLERIFYIAPFMSILEQNSDVIKEIAGDDNILEHYSDFAADIEDENEYSEYQLRTQHWDEPVITTTMVQFLNTLFSGKSSSVKRMHRLSNAVIIIDEVQSVPLRCTSLFSLAVNFLTKVCGSTVVLCSATQPTFDKNERRLLPDDKFDMTGDYSEDFKVFRRTELKPALEKYGHDFDSAADFCEERFEENGDMLLVVNTKKQVLEMYGRLKERLGERAYVIHLSTNMCPAHRKKRIGTLRRFLRRGLPVVCVTTQLIEAGVDISFSCVIRALAGLDNAAQAAGRCNRGGEKGRLCPVYIINFKDENLGSLNEIKSAEEISDNIITCNKDADLLSVEVQSSYFRQLFAKHSQELDYPANGTTLLDLLSLNKVNWEAHSSADNWLISQAFKTAGELFAVIDSHTEDLLIPYNAKAQKLIDQLDREHTPKETAAYLRQAQRYSVSVYVGTKLSLIEAGALRTNINGLLVLNERFYSSEFGVTVEGAEMECLIF